MARLDALHLLETPATTVRLKSITTKPSFAQPSTSNSTIGDQPLGANLAVQLHALATRPAPERPRRREAHNSRKKNASSRPARSRRRQQRIRAAGGTRASDYNAHQEEAPADYRRTHSPTKGGDTLSTSLRAVTLPPPCRTRTNFTSSRLPND